MADAMNQHEQPDPTQPSPPPAAPLRMSSRAEIDPPDPADGPFAIERMEVLSHELGNLLDGSMRCLSLARRLLTRGGSEDEPIERVSRQLDTVYMAMERMADLVNAAMRGSGSVVGSPTLSPDRPITLGEAIRHAIDVLSPMAAEMGVSIVESLEPSAAALHAGPMYSVILNGVRNGVESVARTGGPGRVEVRAFVRGGGGDGASALAVVEILDDGAGVPDREAASRAFRPGCTSKPNGLGVGLSLSREIVHELGGAIDLCPREDLGGARPGAVLRMVFPPPRDRMQQRVG